MEKRAVLVAWEQGGHLGHLLRIEAVVALLQRSSCKVVLAVSETLGHQYAQALASIPCTKLVVREAPRREYTPSPFTVASFAGVLLMQGWADAPWLNNCFTAWVKLYRLIQPMAVVLDYAPLAAWVACALRIPALQISSGFDAPPPQQLGIGRFRSRTGEVSSAEHAEAAEVDANIQQASQRLGLPDAAPLLREALAHAIRVLDCLPQTDPYGARQHGVYAPFVSAAPLVQNVTWPESLANTSQARAFVYMREPTSAQAVLSALARRHISTLCFWPGYDALRSGFTPGNSIHVHTQPLDLSTLFQQASFVVSHGSIGTATRAVLAGLPHLAIPTDVEKSMVAQRLHEQGLGIFVGLRQAPSEMDRAFDLLLSTPAFHEKPEWTRKSIHVSGKPRPFAEACAVAIRQLTRSPT